VLVIKEKHEEVSNGQASDEPKSELKHQTAIHCPLTYDTPHHKLVDCLIGDSIIEEESTQEAMDFLILEKDFE
jgi:hypothetical protein